MFQQTGDLSLEWKTIQQKTLNSIYSLNFNFKSDQNVKLSKNKKKQIQCFAENQYFLSQLIELNTKLTYQINWLFEKAKQHDHTNQQANGFYSMIRILLALFKLISKKLRKLKLTSPLKTEMIELMNVIYYFFVLNNNMIALFDYKTNDCRPLNDDPKNLFSLSIDNFKKINLLALSDDAQRALSIIYGPTGVFWYSSSVQTLFKAFRWLLIGSTSNPIRSLKCILSSKQCGENLSRKCMNSTIEYVTRSLSALEYKAYNRLYFTMINLNKISLYDVETVHIGVRTYFRIPSNEKLNNNDDLSNQHLQKIDGENERKIRCRLLDGLTKSFIRKYCKENNLSSKKIDIHHDFNPSKTVVFHVHGGGFSVNSPDSHEIYLRKWSTKLNGIPIISVDYQLRTAYPRAIQDVLDVYLKLFTIDGKSIRSDDTTDLDKKINEISKSERLFGFEPKNVILVGDSCGGNLILSLLCCLNDIKREQKSEHNFIMPFALTTIYPVFDLRAVCSPSKMIGCLDPILTNSNIMSMHGCYGGLSEHAINCNKIANRIKNRHAKPWFICTEEECSDKNSDEKSPLKDCSKKHVENRFIQMHDHLDGPFASPVLYKHFDDFQNITINLIGSNICPLLDDAIEMYRKWPGKKTFELFDNLPHGFIQFIDLSSSCKKASKKIVQIINTTIEEHCSKLSKKTDETCDVTTATECNDKKDEIKEIDDDKTMEERL